MLNDKGDFGSEKKQNNILMKQPIHFLADRSRHRAGTLPGMQSNDNAFHGDQCERCGLGIKPGRTHQSNEVH
jgi:methionyl-tRNA synthetase